MAKTLRTARAYAVQPVERDAAPVVQCAGAVRDEEERSGENPDRVTAGTGNRRRWWSADVHLRGTGETIVIVDRGVAGFDLTGDAQRGRDQDRAAGGDAAACSAPVSMPTTPVLPVVTLAVGFARDRQSPAQAALLAEVSPFVDAEMVPTRWRGPGRPRHQQGCGKGRSPRWDLRP
jgi:hypothetical protein